MRRSGVGIASADALVGRGAVADGRCSRFDLGVAQVVAITRRATRRLCPRRALAARHRDVRVAGLCKVRRAREGRGLAFAWLLPLVRPAPAQPMSGNAVPIPTAMTVTARIAIVSLAGEGCWGACTR